MIFIYYYSLGLEHAPFAPIQENMDKFFFVYYIFCDYAQGSLNYFTWPQTHNVKVMAP